MSVIFVPSAVLAAAPDDVQLSQRLWLDGLDINADGDTSNNPANGSDVTIWTDKSPNAFIADEADTYAIANREFPTYSTGNGVVYDGVRDVLEVNGGIYGTGTNVTASDIYVVATTASRQVSFLFLSGPNFNTGNRISAHIPWSNNTMYWDHVCCSAGRLTVSWPGTGSIFDRRYLWEFRAQSGSSQTIFRSAVALAAKTNSATYTQLANNHFYIGGGENNPNHTHDGTVSELIVYQRRLNLAEKTLLSNYLQSKWDLPDDLGTIDRYAGDTGVNGNYDFYVGGIGQESDGTASTGTSAGISISNISLLNANGDYLITGVDNLIPITGTAVTDLPVGVSSRSQRIWYLDVTNAGVAGGDVNVTINPTNLGMSSVDGEGYVLLYRATTTGVFSALNSGNVSSGSVPIILNNPVDGYYALGRVLPLLDVDKTASVSSASPGDAIQYQIVVTNIQVGSADNVILVDDMSPYSALGIDTYGSGIPFQCLPGCPVSGVSLGAPVYSNDDGVSFTYVPVSGAGGAPAGFDANVTDWRIPMDGILAPSPGTFTIHYEVSVK